MYPLNFRDGVAQVRGLMPSIAGGQWSHLENQVNGMAATGLRCHHTFRN
jgi:hypothetical protein